MSDLTEKWVKPTYFLGYGSLMYRHGINGRGMKHIYAWEDLSVVTLSGFRRGMFAFAYHDRTYYGILPAEGHEVNAVIFEVFSETDMIALLKNEMAFEAEPHPKYGLVYKPIDVSNKVLPKVTGRVITLVSTADQSSLGTPSEWYIDHVYQGIRYWGPEFRDLFLKTGGHKLMSYAAAQGG